MPEVQQPVQRRPSSETSAPSLKKEADAIDKVKKASPKKASPKKAAPEKTREITEKVELGKQQVLDFKELFANVSCESIAKAVGCQHYQIYHVVRGTWTTFPKKYYKGLMDEVKRYAKFSERLIKNA